MQGSLFDYSILSRPLQVREAATEERKPRVSGLEGTCKVSASWNPVIISAKRLPSL